MSKSLISHKINQIIEKEKPFEEASRIGLLPLLLSIKDNEALIWETVTYSIKFNIFELTKWMVQQFDFVLTYVELPHNNNLMHLAAYYSDEKTAEYINTKNPTLIYASNNFAGLPLQCAARLGNVSAFKYLLALKSYYIHDMPIPDINTVREGGDTLLMLAVKSGKLDAIEYVISAGADVNAHTITGMTALHIAGRKSDLAIWEMLVEAGARIDATDYDLNTPLSLCSPRMHKELGTTDPSFEDMI